MKTDVIASKSGRELYMRKNVRDTQHLRELSEMEIGQETKKALDTQIKKEQHNHLLMDMRSFFMCSVEYLQKICLLTSLY
jgi:hypothetical protein